MATRNEVASVCDTCRTRKPTLANTVTCMFGLKTAGSLRRTRRKGPSAIPRTAGPGQFAVPARLGRVRDRPTEEQFPAGEGSGVLAPPALVELPESGR